MHWFTAKYKIKALYLSSKAIGKYQLIYQTNHSQMLVDILAKITIMNIFLKISGFALPIIYVIIRQQ